MVMHHNRARVVLLNVLLTYIRVPPIKATGTI